VSAYFADPSETYVIRLNERFQRSDGSWAPAFDDSDHTVTIKDQQTESDRLAVAGAVARNVSLVDARGQPVSKDQARQIVSESLGDRWMVELFRRSIVTWSFLDARGQPMAVVEASFKRLTAPLGDWLSDAIAAHYRRQMRTEEANADFTPGLSSSTRDADPSPNGASASISLDGSAFTPTPSEA